MEKSPRPNSQVVSRRNVLKAVGPILGAAALSGNAFRMDAEAMTAPGVGPDAVRDQVNWEKFMARQDLVWDTLPKLWDGGAFLGNGLLGTMIYSPEGEPMRWEICRSDVTDNQGWPGIPGKPYDPYQGRSRLAIGHLILEPVGKPTGGTMRLTLWDAQATGTLLTDRGAISWRSFIHTTQMAIVVELKTEGAESGCKWKWVAGVAAPLCVQKHTFMPPGYKLNPPPRIEKNGEMNLCIQPLARGGGYATAWREVSFGANHRMLVVSVGNSLPFTANYHEDVLHHHWPKVDVAVREATEAVDKAIKTGIPALVASQRKWWHAYYPASFVSLPDARMESFYWIQMYKLASTTRPDRPAIDLLGVWYMKTGWASIWWDLNIQLTYYPVGASNRLELGESLCRMLDNNLENLSRNVPNKQWQKDSAVVGLNSSYDCISNGSMGGNLVWAANDYWKQNRSAMDDVELREKLFPLLRRSVNYFMHIKTMGPDGRYHMPKDWSPEYGSTTDINYDLSLFRWGCTALLETCERLHIDDPLIPQWKEVLAKLVNYPQKDDVLWIGDNMPLAHGHRHYSHLFMIYPLYLVNWDQKENRELIEKSIDHWVKLSDSSHGGNFSGFSYAGAASMYASIGRRNDAVRILNQGLTRTIQANTMYMECNMPCGESPPAFAQAINDLLLQSWASTIRVFPGVPDAWKDVTFHNMRALGAFLVSAVRRRGQNLWVRVESLAGEPCRVKPGFTGAVKIRADRAMTMKHLPDGVVELDLKKGEVVVLYSGDSMPALDIRPVTRQTGISNWYGSVKKNSLRRGRA